MIRFVTKTRPFFLSLVSDEVTLDDLNALHTFCTQLHANGRRFCMMAELRAAKVPPAGMRRSISQVAAEFNDRRIQNTVATAHVLPSRLAIGTLTAVRWFIPDSVPFLYVSTAHSGLAALRVHADAESLILPAAAEQVCLQLDELWDTQRDFAGGSHFDRG